MSINKFFLSFVTLLFILSCSRQVNELSTSNDNSSGGSDTVNSDTTDTSDSGQGTDGGSSSSSTDDDTEDCYANGTGDSANNYITISPIIGKGSQSGTVQWSSSEDPNFQSTGDQEIFLTDSRLNIRVLANSSPGQGETTAFGHECEMLAVPYQKLQVKVGVKVEGSYGYQSTHVFDDIDVGGCSDVYEFSVTPSSSPLIIEILETKWDYSCTWAKEVNDSNYETYCPFSYVWDNDCFSVGLQIATDHTKDIPH